MLKKHSYSDVYHSTIQNRQDTVRGMKREGNWEIQTHRHVDLKKIEHFIISEFWKDVGEARR